MQPQLRDIIERIESSELRELVSGVFSDFNRLLGYLDRVKIIVRLEGSVDEAHFIFEALRCEALAAAGGLDYFCACLDTSDELSEELERMSFAVHHELKAAFERMRPGSQEAEPDADTRTRLADAHDMLRNCFEQSTASLARVFRPRVDAAELFEDIRAKRDNSVRLYEDLDALLHSTRYAEWHEGTEAISLFTKRLEIFSDESMQHLMQKDRETCLGFIDGFASVRDRKSVRLSLHRFSCYLEILLKHVGMRSVLAEASHCVAA
jgi:hypothetical protein